MDELTHNSGKPETINSHYNGKNGKNFLKRGKQEKHAELFRKDLISAMKMADSENLQPDDYLKILDPWKGEWEKGVQVPVNPNAFTPIYNDVKDYHKKENFDLFFLPKNFLHSLDQMNENFKPAIHEPYSLLLQQQNQCAYDLDEVDVAWLTAYNQSRALLDDCEVSEEDMERIIEELEVQTRCLLGQKLEDVERLGREYDESVVCDVCRSPEGEEDNEMVFCDNCDICVHQACYGIQEIPDGSWLCRTCSINIKPKCLLCSQTGGAMKCTREGDKWAHISCALWIPEVSIGCPEKMEPITDLDLVLPSRWTLLCVLCKQDSGACIQCSVKSCKVSFHVTCAFRHNLNLTTVIDDETEDVQMKAYCPLHSGLQSHSQDKANGEDVVGRIGKRHKEVFTEQMKKEKLRQIAEDFYKVVNLEDIRSSVDLPFDLVNVVFEYWKLKRRSQFDKPLIMVNVGEDDDDEDKEDDSQNDWMRHMVMKLQMFVQLRQDLQRVRNLCYMVSKREKTSRRLQRNKEEIFSLQNKFYNNLSKHPGDVSQFKMTSEKFKSKSEGAIVNHRLSDSDYDNYDDDDDGLGRSVIMKYKRENSDEENYDDDDSRVIFNNNSDVENNETKLKKDLKVGEEDLMEKMTPADFKWLQGAHKSSGSLYDDPSFVLSCNFQDDDHIDCRLNRRLVNLSSLPLNLFREEDNDVHVKSNFIPKINNDKMIIESHTTPSIHTFNNNHSSFNNINNRANHSRKNFDDEYLVDSLGEEEDENKTFNKGSKMDLKEREWLRRKKMVNKVKGVRGRPKKKRGRPPKNALPASPSIKDEDEVDKEHEEKEEVREDYEDDDSDYYRRLSDEDIDTIVKPSPINKKLNTATPTGAKKLNKGGRPRKIESAGSLNNIKNDVAVPKKRGRKRKSELLANANNKINEEDDLELPKKRKYTRKSERKEFFDRKDGIEKLDDSDEHTKISNSHPSSSSSPSVHEMFGASNIKKGLHKRGSRLRAFDSDDDDDDDVSFNDDVSDNDSKYEQSSNHAKFKENNLDKSDVQNDIDEKLDVKTTEMENSDMFSSSDSEKEDNSLVENLLSRSRTKYKQTNDRSSSVLMHDLELSDSEDEDNEERRKKAAELKIDNEKDNNGVDENNTESKWVESPTPIYPPVTKVASLLSKGCIIPEEKVSSSDDDEDDDLYAKKTSNLSTEKPKSDSKKTGIKNQDLLNIKIKQILLHKLPSKDFIVSSHLKSVVRDFFCGHDNNGKSDYKFSFNGFNLPQKKIVC